MACETLVEGSAQRTLELWLETSNRMVKPLVCT